MLKKFSQFFLVFLIITGWVFSGQPQVFNFPPKVQEAQAGSASTPVITLAAGSYTGIQTTTITVTGGATICYTTDGSTPGAATAGTCDGAPTYTYSSDLSIDHSQTIKAIGTKSKSTNSSVASSAYTITVNTPIFGTNGGSFNNDTSSTISDTFTGATICYTTDGATPSATSGTCTNDGHTQTYSTPVSITATGVVIKAIGTKSGSTNSSLATSNAFTLTVGAITSSPGAGTYTSPQDVTLSINTTTGATAHYTTDGSAVSCSSQTYSGSFNISSTATVKAIGCKTNYDSSSAISDLYTISAPAAPTNVAATKTLSDKVTITWTKSAGATDYHVWRDSTDLGAAGDVATFDDTGTEAPTITAGSAVASDGSSAAQVDLSLSGASANNGTSHTYKVIASNVAGNSPDSATDTGYRKVGSLTYQWQRSAGDSNSNYSDISGATTADYGDTEAPADGSGRYYKVIENATGASQQMSASDRGYRKLVSISLDTNGSVDFGFIPKNTVKDSTASGINDIEVVRIDSGPADLDIKSAIFSQGGNTWTLGASNGDNIVKWEFSKDGSNWTTFANADPTSYVFDTNVAQDATRNVYFKITTPTATNSYQQYGTTVTIVASAP